MKEGELIQLVQRARAGDVPAFEQLVREHENDLFRLISRHGPREETEVIAQESFLAAYQALSSLREPKLFRGWLNGIAVRKCKDAWRERYRRGRLLSREGDAARDGGSESTLLAREILNSLSPDDRMILTLLYLEEYSVSEVAKLLSISEVAVKVRAHRLRKRIAKRVEDE